MSSGNKNLYHVISCTIYCIEREPSKTKMMWTVHCGTNLARWILCFGSSPFHTLVTFARKSFTNCKSPDRISTVCNADKQTVSNVSISLVSSGNCHRRETPHTLCSSCHRCKESSPSDFQYGLMVAII